MYLASSAPEGVLASEQEPANDESEFPPEMEGVTQPPDESAARMLDQSFMNSGGYKPQPPFMHRRLASQGAAGAPGLDMSGAKAARHIQQQLHEYADLYRSDGMPVNRVRVPQYVELSKKEEGKQIEKNKRLLQLLEQQSQLESSD